MKSVHPSVLGVVFASGTDPEPLRQLTLEGRPFWPPSSVFVNQRAHLELMAASTGSQNESGWSETWNSKQELLLHIYCHFLANIVNHLLTGGYLAADRDWMASRCRAWGNQKPAAATARLKSGVVYSVDYVFVSKASLAATLCPDGRVVLS